MSMFSWEYRAGSLKFGGLKRVGPRIHTCAAFRDPPRWWIRCRPGPVDFKTPHHNMSRSGQAGGFTRLAAFFLLLTVVLGLLFMFFLSHILQYGITAKTGFPTRMGEFSSNPLRGKLAVEDFHVENPESFSRQAFLEINRLRFKVSPASLFRERVVVEHIEVEIAQLTGIREAGGRINFEEFRTAVEGLREERNRASGKSFAINRLQLKIDRVLLVDYSREGPERSSEYEVNLDLSFEDVTSLRLVAPEVLRQLAAAGVPFDRDSIFSTLIPERYREGLWSQVHGGPGISPQNRD